MSDQGDLARCSLLPRPETIRKHSILCDPRTFSVWNDMKCTIFDIMRQENSKEVITDTVYNAVRLPLMRNSDFIFSDLYGHLESIVGGIAENLLENVENEFLRNLLEEWNKYRFSITLVSHLFPILDGVVARETDCTFVNIGRTIFEKNIFQHEVIRDYITKSLLNMVEDERRGILVDRSLFSQTCWTLKYMSICDNRRYTSFEKKFLEESKYYYKRKCQELLSTNDAYEYLSQVECILNREERRLSFCLQESAARANILLAEKELIHRRLGDIITLESNGLMEMLSENKTCELALLYRVVRRVLMGKTVIADHISLYLQKCTRQLLEDMKVLPADSLVDSIFEMADRMDEFVVSCFSNDKFLKSAVCAGFRKFVTCDEKLAQFVARYTDNVMKNHARESERGVDVKLCKLFRVNSFLHCKDAVQSLYKMYLSDRLLLHVPNLYEEFGVVQMQFVLGQPLMGVHGMLLDIKRSEILSDIFEKHPKVVRPTSRGTACEFSMRLLSSAYWPLVPPSKNNVVLPPRPRYHFINFSNFYKVISRSRRLILLPQYGTAEIVVYDAEYRHRASKVSFASFPSLTSDLSSATHIVIAKAIISKMEVSTVQMCILCLFNDADKLTVKEMRKNTNLETPLLLWALKPLCAKKVLLPDNHVQSRHFDAYSEFRVNPELYSTRVLKLYGGVADDKTSVVESSTKVAREMATDVVILRIMKVNKFLSHDVLVSETVKILKNSVFLPTSFYVTKRINALIQRDMLKRKPQYSNIYCFS